ncbi:MAG: zinc ribbon domain-containing protein [Sciscionella sp.]
MKADPAAQRTLLDLAGIDAELSRLEHRRRTLPELAEVAELDLALRAKRDAVITAETALGDLDRESKRQEKEIDAVRSREDRDRKLLDSGVGVKQVADIEHELATLRRRQSALEDDLLELMERREAVASDVEHARVELAKTEEAHAEANRRRDEALADLDTSLLRRAEDREATAGKVPAELLSLYERLRAQKGIGAALLRSQRCGACRLELGANEVRQIRDTPEDEVVRCEECGAILVRTAESGL